MSLLFDMLSTKCGQISCYYCVLNPRILVEEDKSHFGISVLHPQIWSQNCLTNNFWFQKAHKTSQKCILGFHLLPGRIAVIINVCSWHIVGFLFPNILNYYLKYSFKECFLFSHPQLTCWSIFVFHELDHFNYVFSYIRKKYFRILCCCSVTQSCPTLCDPMDCSTPDFPVGLCSNSCSLSQWCHTTISSSATLFSSCLQSFPASGSFPMSHLFTSGGQSIGASASASDLSMNIQSWFPLEWLVWSPCCLRLGFLIFTYYVITQKWTGNTSTFDFGGRKISLPFSIAWKKMCKQQLFSFLKFLSWWCHFVYI